MNNSQNPIILFEVPSAVVLTEQFSSFPLPNSSFYAQGVENRLQYKKADGSKQKKYLDIRDPYTNELVKPTNDLNKESQIDATILQKKRITNKFKEEVSNRVKSNLPTENLNTNLTNFLLNETTIQPEKAIAEMTAELVLADDCKHEVEQPNVNEEPKPVLNTQPQQPLLNFMPNFVKPENIYPEPFLEYVNCKGCNPSAKTSIEKSKIKNIKQNSNGIYVYDREFLISLKDSNSEVCAKNQILSDRPDWLKKDSGKSKENTPNGEKYNVANARGRFQRRTSADNRRIKKNPIARDSLDRYKYDKDKEQPTATKTETVEIRKSANAWKPRRELIREAGGESEEAKTEKKKKEIRSLLNKITPTNFDALVDEFINFRIYEDDNILNEAVMLIFEKVIDEPKFCSLYSDLCLAQITHERKMSRIRYEEENEKLKESLDKKKEQNDKKKEMNKKEQAQSNNKFLNLGKVSENEVKNELKSFPASQVKTFKAIIGKCQKSFEDNTSYENVLREFKQKIKKAPEDEKCQLLEKLELMRAKEKRRILGNIRFIAQLYCRSLININIISFCVCSLIRLYQAENDEIYIEYITQFIETVGRKYTEEKREFQQKFNEEIKSKVWEKSKNLSEIQKPQSEIETMYNNIEKVFAFLSQSKENFSTRFKFMIMNLEDLRANNWEEREINRGPKKLDELHKEYEHEQIKNEKQREEYNKKIERYGGGGSKYSREQTTYAGRNSMKRDKEERPKLSKIAYSGKTTVESGDLSSAVANNPAKLGRKNYFISLRNNGDDDKTE